MRHRRVCTILHPRQCVRVPINLFEVELGFWYLAHPPRFLYLRAPGPDNCIQKLPLKGFQLNPDQKLSR